MALDFRTKNALLLAKIEAAAGTEEAPVPGSDAIRIRDAISFTPNFRNFEEGYVQESVSQAAPIISGGGAGFRLPVWMTGAAAPGTAAPDWGTLMKGAAFGETKTAAPVAGTSQAIAAGTITLAAGASAVDNFYRGMPIDGTSGSNNGQRRWIMAYNGTTKVATIFPDWTGVQSGTPAYSIPANALYTPLTLSQKALTIWAYQHDSVAANTSRRRRAKGAMGNGTISVRPSEPVSLDFTFTGQLPANPDDVARPAAGTFVGTTPEPYINAVTNLGNTAVKFNEFSLDFGNRVAQYDDPAQANGLDTAEVTMRSMTGRITPCLTHITSRDAFSDWLAQTSKALVLAWGTATGKKIALLLPALRYTGNEPGDVNGYQVEGIPFRATGLDTEVFISVS
jgi:hypothetical protein